MNLQSIKDRLARPNVYEVSLSEVQWLIERLEAAENLLRDALPVAIVHANEYGDEVPEWEAAVAALAGEEKPSE